MTIMEMARQRLVKKIKRWRRERAEWVIFVHTNSKHEFYIETDATAGMDDFLVTFYDDRFTTAWETREDRAAAKRGEDPNRYNSFYLADPNYEENFMLELYRWAVYMWKADELDKHGYETPDPTGTL